MNTRIFTLLILTVLSAFTVACAAQAVSGAPNDTTGEPAASGVVEDQEDLVRALHKAGAEVEMGDPVEQVFFSVPGQILKVNGADVQVFEYESAEAMGIEASQVSEDGSSIGTSMVTWVSTPHFFQSGRVLLLYVGEDTVVLDLLMGALGEQFAGR